MTVAELIELLQEQPQDAPVQLAIQPNHPLAVTVRGVVLVEDEESSEEPVVWISEGTQVGYAPRAAFDAGY